MCQHRRFTIDTDDPVYFCDPHSPWQRGSNESTNGLLRQYFPKSSDLRVIPRKIYLLPPRISTAAPGNPRLGHPSATAGYAPQC